MNERIKKIITMLLISLLAYTPIISFADNQELNSPQIIKQDDEKCIIYIEELQNTKFNYSISQNQDGEYDKLSSFESVNDSENNQVAIIEKQDLDFDKNSKGYLKIKQDNKISTVEIDFSKAITKQDLQNVETTCNRIKTEILTDLVEEDYTTDDKIHKILKVGGLKIENENNSQYFYDIKDVNNNDFEIMDIAEKINNEYKEMDMYNKIKIAKEFNEKYNQLIENAEWKEVQENTIKQPKEAEENSKYLVLIKEVTNNEETTDIKFLTSIEDKNEAYENEKIAVQETSKLPITGDSIILIIAFVLILIAIAFTFIKMRKNNEKKSK